MPEENMNELISKETRKKMARNMAKIAKKGSTKLKKARAAMKMPTPEKIKKKARAKAKAVFVNKLIGGKSWNDLSDQEKSNIEKKLVKKKSAIEKLSKKLMKAVKKQELARVKANREK